MGSDGPWLHLHEDDAYATQTRESVSSVQTGENLAIGNDVYQTNWRCEGDEEKCR